ncbi:MAG: hypothetical protein J5623_01265 [Clostridiales bacterium]|nr:hypothetical protein [Clostridiales bacterium]
MENNNYQQQYAQQPQYYTTPGYQAVNQQYLDQANALLKSAIIACVLAGFPICSIIAIFKGINNRKKVLDYLAQGGLHTPRIKICSILSRAATYYGIGSTVLYFVMLLYYALIIGAIILSATRR